VTTHKAFGLPLRHNAQSCRFTVTSQRTKLSVYRYVTTHEAFSLPLRHNAQSFRFTATSQRTKLSVYRYVTTHKAFGLPLCHCHGLDVPPWFYVCLSVCVFVWAWSVECVGVVFPTAHQVPSYTCSTQHTCSSSASSPPVFKHRFSANSLPDH